MKRKLLRRRSLFVLMVLCLFMFVFGKFVILSIDNDKMGIYYNVRAYTDMSNVKQMLPVVRRLPMRRVYDVSCDAIIKGDKQEIQRAEALMKTNNFTRKAIKESDYIEMTKNCDKFKRTRGYENYILSAEEANFSIAYSILLYKEVEQAERLMRAIYTPNNCFCLHVDADAKPEVHKAVQGIADCFDNVFVVSRKEYVVYSGYTRLQADLNCMENMLHHNSKWQYFINLPSQEFPLKTNAEIVRILKIYNGANDIEGLTGNRRLEARYKHRFVYKHVDNQVKPKIYKTNQPKNDPPYNITVVKGSAYGIFGRAFVRYVTYNKIAREVLDWFRDVLSPDEYYWATLNFNHHIGTPGSFYKGKPDDKPWLAALALWAGQGKCHGKYVHGVCVYGVGDLQMLTTKNNLFANKFFLESQPYALDCIEEWLLNRTATSGLKDLNISYYESLPFIGREPAS